MYTGENIMLTILGSMVGIVMGYFLHRYVMTTVEVDMLMFGRQIRPVSYAYSVLMTYAFSFSRLSALPCMIS